MKGWIFWAGRLDSPAFLASTSKCRLSKHLLRPSFWIPLQAKSEASMIRELRGMEKQLRKTKVVLPCVAAVRKACLKATTFPAWKSTCPEAVIASTSIPLLSALLDLPNVLQRSCRTFWDWRGFPSKSFRPKLHLQNNTVGWQHELVENTLARETRETRLVWAKQSS